MRYPVDLGLFEQTTHTPSLFTLERSMGSSARPIRDYCIPVNSYFPSAELLSEWVQMMPRALRYYPADNLQITNKVCDLFQLDSRSVVMFNGATELLTWLDQLFVRRSLLTPIPTFGRWTDVPLATGKRLITVPRREECGFALDLDELTEQVRREAIDAVVICNPNNPTGQCLTRDQSLHMLDRLQDLSLVVIDESFLEFSDAEANWTMVDEAVRRENVVVVKSLGKALGLHGIRLGYSVSHPRLAEKLRRHIPHWNINAIAELVLDCMPANMQDYRRSLQLVINDRRLLFRDLQQIPGLQVFPSQANFVFCRIPTELDGGQLRDRLLTEYGFLVRHCGNKLGSSSDYFRFVARPDRERTELVTALKHELELGCQNVI